MKISYIVADLKQKVKTLEENQKRQKFISGVLILGLTLIVLLNL